MSSERRKLSVLSNTECMGKVEIMVSDFAKWVRKYENCMALAKDLNIRWNIIMRGKLEEVLGKYGFHILSERELKEYKGGDMNVGKSKE